MSHNDAATMAGFERLVTSEPVEYSACGEPLHQGTLVLSDHRVVLDAGGGHLCEVPLGAIRRMSLSPFRRRLRLDVGDDVVLILGERVTRIYGALSALLNGPAAGDELAAGAEELLDAIDGMLMRGPLAHPGELVVTTRRLHFRAHRRLDELAGAGPFDVPLAGVVEVGLRGWPERRLVVTTPEAEHVFALSHPVETMQRLGQLLVRAETFGLGPVPFGELPLLRDAAPILATWRPHVRLAESDQPRLALPAARWVREHAAQRGWLVLTAQHLSFLPLAGPGSAEPFVAPLHELGASAGTDASQLVVTAGEESVRLSVLGGARTVRRLMPRLTLSAVLPEAPQSEGALRQLVGELTSLRLLAGEEELLSRSGEQLVEMDGGIGLLLTMTPDVAFDEGAPVTIEAGKGEGVYRFGARVRGLRRASDLGEPGSGVLLELEQTTDIAFTNRRGHFRAPAQLVATMRRLVYTESRGYEPAGPDEEVAVADLSTGGCRLLVAGELGVGDEKRLTLDLSAGRTEVDARVVRSLGPAAVEGHTMYGVGFFNVTQPVHDRVQREVFRLQRELLLRRADARMTMGSPTASA